ncbi:amino acid permease [Bacillus spongiae]|uniref:Amino acid permease n=1 Tax=Bacillus spongiae TaxID=2683610 RepID=A0ABU8HGZ6_9BACI
MNEKKLTTLQLIGLIVGPILGSGIILLPPIIYDVTGDYAIISWMTIMGINLYFAFLFGQLSIRFPGSSGVTKAVEIAFGKHLKILASLFLIGAVCFGPIAVLITAAQFFPLEHPFATHLMTFIFMVLTYLILLLRVSFIGKIAFLLSSISAILLFAGGATSLVLYPKEKLFSTSFELSSFGFSLLLLFWTIVGWEVIGNYSSEVKNAKKTIPKAIGFSALIITLVCLTVAAAIQWSNIPNLSEASSSTVASILTPMFGSTTGLIIGIIAPGLCLTSVILFIGAAARLIQSLANDNVLPKKLRYVTKHNVPLGGILVLSACHLFIFSFVVMDWINVTQIVAIADVFFISNVLVSMLASIKLFQQKTVNILTGLMVVVLMTFLFFSPPILIAFIALLSLIFIYKQVRLNLVHSNSQGANVKHLFK